MSTPETPAPPPEQKPPGRFKQSQIDNNQAVEDWLGGNGRIVFAVIGIVMVLGFIYFCIVRLTGGAI